MFCVVYLSQYEKDQRPKHVFGVVFETQTSARAWITKDMQEHNDSEDNYEILPLIAV